MASLTVWSNTQTPFQDRRLLSELLDLPENRVRIIKPAMGGGFGARQQIHNQHVGGPAFKTGQEACQNRQHPRRRDARNDARGTVPSAT